MPTLDWIGKNKVINHHMDVPYRTLDRQYSFDENGKNEDDNGSENMIIHGDNLEALKALLPKYEAHIKCIYIDPPYNTGNENWVYNDNVNDPKIKKWLGEIVGKEEDDLTRHDKWLCMMYPRLRLLGKLLSKDGCMVISISYHELHNLISICREIFSDRQVVTVTVQTSGGKPSGGFNYVQEYLVFIVPVDFTANSLEFCGGNTRTPFEGLTLSTFNKVQRPNQVYPIFIDVEREILVGVGESLQSQINCEKYQGAKEDFKYEYSDVPAGTVAVWPITSKGKECVWRQISDRLMNDWEKGYIKVSKNRSKNSSNEYSIQYLPEGVIKKIENGELTIVGNEENKPTLIFGENQTVGSQIPTIWSEKEFFTVNGTQLMKKIFPEREKAFDYPKSVDLVMAIIQAISDENDIILDSFAGSGTTAHAVLDLKSKDNKNRKFILIEMGEYAENLTSERIKRVISGYSDIPGTGGNFSYYELGESIITGTGINPYIDINKVREYIFYMETKQPLADLEINNKFYLGGFDYVDYYFFYKKDEVTILDYEFLASIKKKCEAYVIYADKCVLSHEELLKYNITFKKIPRDIQKA